MVTPKELGNVFKEARERRDLSIEDAYRQSRIHPRVILDIESGIFDKMGKIYLRSFLKKYSLFLGLDPNETLKQYDVISSEIPDREFNLDEIEVEEEKKVEEPILPALKDQKVQVAVVAGLSVILIVLVFVLIGMMRSRMAGARKAQKAKVSLAAPSKVSTTPVKSVPVQKPMKRVVNNVKPLPEEVTASVSQKAVNLTLAATGEVWLQVKAGDKRLFEGFLSKGDAKTWKEDGAINIWTGKAENLTFIVNSHRLGAVAAGVIRNIEVSPGGVKIGDTWVAEFE